jgi:two-component system, probable response regulator PhcQ
MRQTVLTVDDDARLLDGIKRTLRLEPYRLLSATSGEAALELLQTERIDVIVSDDQMPGLSGTEFLATVRTDYPAIVSIMLSGQTSMGTVIHAINDGDIFRYLIKPCNQGELTTAIRQALAHKLVLDHCRRLLPIVRGQAALLGAIEQRHPGIIRAVAAEAITQALCQDGAKTTDELARRMEEEIAKGEAMLGAIPEPATVAAR